MGHRTKLLLISVLIVVSVSLIVGTVTIGTLYGVSLQQRRADLVHTVRSQARLMEAVAKVNLASNDNDPAKATPLTLRQFVDAHERFEGIGKTGEFTLAKREGNHIVFLLRHRHADHRKPQSVAWDSLLAEPMRRALSGRSGTLVGLDYRGETVVAAHEPVAGLNWGIVAKMDLAEVRAPFVRAGLTTAAATILITLIGVIILVRVSNPLIDRLEQVEESVRKSERQFRLAVESSPSAMVMINQTGTIQLVNVETERLFGYDRSELLGQPIERLIPERFRDEHPVLRDGFFANPEPRRMGAGRDLFGLRSDGSEFPIEIGLNPLETDEGWRVLSSIVDITERKQSETALREGIVLGQLQYDINVALARGGSLRDVLQVCAQAIVDHLDAAFARVWTLNEQEQMLELQASAGLYTHLDGPHGRVPVGQFKIGLIAAERQPHLTNSVVGDQRVSDQEWAQREGMVAFAGYPLIADDRVIGVMAMFARRQLTETTLRAMGSIAQGVALGIERVKAEEDLRAALYDLAARSRQLEVAKEQAEAADRVKSAFLATMSHELRTPLNSIIGFTGIMTKGLTGPLNEEQTKQLGMVQGSARHLLNLINDVLDISKIEAGQFEIESKPFRLEAAVDKAVKTVTPAAQQKSLRVRTRVAPEIGEIVGDQRRVQQVLLNLINNAVKFTDAGEVCVSCELSDDNVVTRVADTGCGIKPDDMGKLFKAFQQLDSGIARQHEGTGLGLAICKRLVELMGGRISAESTWNEGSTFSFTIPLAATATDTLAPLGK